ncbi:MAG: sulfatase [Candidatus Aenigmarchaeota archaeon]|nr:sulfatase [Candidatus Aenigmarchaeota archaeon]
MSIDTLRADHMGLYGYARNTTPNIDKLATNSIVFENMIAQSAWTLPSHASMLTGFYPFRLFANFDLLGSSDSIDGNYSMVSETLSENGYKTAAFTAGGFVGEKYGFGRGFDEYHSTTKTRQVQPQKVYLNESNLVFDWLNDNKNSKFFLFFHTFAPHDPYLPPEPYDTVFDPNYTGKILGSRKNWEPLLSSYYGKLGIIGNDTQSEDIFVKYAVPYYWSFVNESDPEDVEHIKALYDGEILYTDNFIGMLIEKLKQEGVYGKTVVIITSDHGEEFGEHGNFRHAKNLYDTTIKIPLLIHIPGNENDMRVKTVAQHADIVPTVLDILKIKAATNYDGASLISFVKNSKKPVYAFSFHGDLMSMRTDEWKLIGKHGDVNEFYNITSDGGETRNLIENIKRLDSFLALLDRWKQTAGYWFNTAYETVDIMDNLRRIGYVV